MSYQIILKIIFGILLAVFVEQSVGFSKCFEAKTCVHNANEKCGEDKDGNVRRFLDTCDLKEYNCLKETDFVKTDPVKCDSLPPIAETEDTQNTNADLEDAEDVVTDKNNTRRTLAPGRIAVVNKYWCWRARHCRLEDNEVCSRDLLLDKRRIFENVCRMYKHNCYYGHDFTATTDSKCSKTLKR